MGRARYLADSNCIADYLGRKLPEAGMVFVSEIFDASKLSASVITKIEVLGFNAPEEYQRLLIEFIGDVNVIGLSDDIVDQSISIRKKHKIKLPDAIIAASAVTNKLTLVTRNEKDFQHIKGLTVINPWLVKA